MNVLTYIMAAFSVIGALDLITGNHLKLGQEFERAIKLAGTIFLSMLGMLVLTPAISAAISPFLRWLAGIIPFDPAVIAGSLLANDMGGTQLAAELGLSELSGKFNGLIVGATMGATISYTLPLVMSAVNASQRKSVLLGLMCGICAIPVGCLVGGFMVGMSFIPLLQSLVPLVIIAAIIVFGLVKFPNISIKIFNVFGIFLKSVILVGLSIGVLELLVGDIIPLTNPVDEGVMIIFKAVAVMTGAFPLISILTRLLKKPLGFISKRAGINEAATFGFIGTLATNLTTYAAMPEMDERGVVLNAAFTVSASWTFAGHLSWTLIIDPSFVPAVIVTKLISGILGVVFAVIVYKLVNKNAQTKASES